MKLESLLSHARYLALALPVFALFSTVHSGCTNNSSGYYNNYGYGGRRPTAGSGYVGLPPAECTSVARPNGYGGYTYTTCDDGYDGYDGP